MAKREKPIDWAGIERDFVAGRMSVREIGRWYEVTETAVRKKAKQAGWARDRVPGHVERAAQVTAVLMEPTSVLAPADLAEKARGLAGRMLDELDAVTSHHGEIEDMICTEESDPRRRQALLKALSLGERAMTLKNLSLTMKTLLEAAGDTAAGKKEQRQANGERVARTPGRYASPAAPKLIVDNGR